MIIATLSQHEGKLGGGKLCKSLYRTRLAESGLAGREWPGWPRVAWLGFFVFFLGAFATSNRISEYIDKALHLEYSSPAENLVLAEFGKLEIEPGTSSQ
jgi:hypothetical protein